MFSNYYEVRDWLEGFIPLVYGKEELGLVRISYLLKLLGNPQDKFKSIHIAGTSGKGSTAFYIAQLLRNSKLQTPPLRPTKSDFEGRANSKLQTISEKSNNKKNWKLEFGHWNFIPKVGLHVSPHLVDIRERMQIFSSVIPAPSKGGPVSGGKAGIYIKRNLDPRFREDDNEGNKDDNLIPMKRFIRLMGEMKVVVEKIQKEKPELTPSYFEILVAASFKHFAEEKVDWAVVEVGLGGRLDATNVLQPELSIITNIGLDHTEILGKTIEKIAYEKAGIIKSATTEDTEFGHENTGKGKTAKRHLWGKAGLLSGEHPGGEQRKVGVPVLTGAGGKGLKVIKKIARLVSSPLYTIRNGHFSEPRRAKEKGSNVYQISTQELINGLSRKPFSSGAVLAISALKVLGIPLEKSAMEKVFNQTFAGRFEEIDGPTSSGKAGLRGAGKVILDGAHNPDKIRFLIQWIKRKFTVNSSQFTVIIAFKKGKNWKKMVDLLIGKLQTPNSKFQIKEIIATKYQVVTDTGKGSAVEPEEIAAYIKSKWKVKVESFKNSQEAVFESIQSAYSTSEVKALHTSEVCRVLVTGSLYLVGEVRTMWQLPTF